MSKKSKYNIKRIVGRILFGIFFWAIALFLFKISKSIGNENWAKDDLRADIFFIGIMNAIIGSVSIILSFYNKDINIPDAPEKNEPSLLSQLIIADAISDKILKKKDKE